MRPGPAYRLAVCFALVACDLAACAPKSAPKGSALDNQIAAAVGDPSTCVLVADATTGKVVYQYGVAFNCDRALPACDQPGSLSARDALKFATRPNGRLASCPSSADGARNVGWAAGPVPSKTRKLIYSAVMEGERALPGHEMNARLYDAFVAAGM